MIAFSNPRFRVVGAYLQRLVGLSKRCLMNSVLVLGIILMVVAIFGGGLTALGIKFPPLASRPRQVSLFVLGAAIALAVWLSSMLSSPRFPEPPSPNPEKKLFDSPIYEGHRVDRCYVPRQQCDLYAATQFCIANKYAVATAFDIARGVGQTISMGDPRNPKVPDGVDAFNYIICTNPIPN